MLSAILESVKRVEDEGGIPWDEWHKGQVYKLLFIPYIVLVKADSKEADSLCGAYGCNTEGIGNICRMCCIPASQTDEPYIEPEPEPKTTEMIVDLVKTGNEDRLKELSQYNLWNAFYRHQFGMHSNAGIHGASPMETLHWVQLNMFKYDRECLFLQTGTDSILSTQIDILAQTYGCFLERQSDRNIPRTKFTDGIRAGKMQANEMSGLILLLALTMRSRAGRNLLLDTARGNQKEHFFDDNCVLDWIRMLEMHLMFEMWLRKEEHDISVLERAKTKVKEFMSLTKHVLKRTKGMGLKISSFHTTYHMPKLALDLCAPLWWNTECNETHHKPDKKTAARTNRQMDTFEISVAVKRIFRQAIEMALAELTLDVRRDDYYCRPADEPEKEPQPFDPILTGASAEFYHDPEEEDTEDDVYYRINTNMVGSENYEYDVNTKGYMIQIMRDIRREHGPKTLNVYGQLNLFSTQADKNNQIFYAMPYCQGKPWNDWAIFDLSDPDSDTPMARSRVPAQIMCFLDLRKIPEPNALGVEAGIYAIIEEAFPNADPEELWRSQLFEPIIKHPCPVQGLEQHHNRQSLCNIDRIVQPAVVVPDHENPNPRAYLRMIPRNAWAGMFDFWLNQDHVREFE